MSQSTHLAHNFNIVATDSRVFAPTAFEQTFDTLDGLEPYTAPVVRQAETYFLPAAVIGTGAAAGTSRPEVLARRTAQLVARRFADEALDTMAFLGEEFDSDAFARHAGRVVVESMAPSLQSLARTRRVEVAALAVDPPECGEDLDLLLDRVGRMLSVYCDYLPSQRWEPMVLTLKPPDGLRVIGWRGPDGEVVFDLLDTFGPGDDILGRVALAGDLSVDDEAPDDGGARVRDEVDEVLRVGRDRFGSSFTAVRYLPTFQMRHARVFYANGYWDPFGKTALPTLRLLR